MESSLKVKIEELNALLLSSDISSEEEIMALDKLKRTIRIVSRGYWTEETLDMQKTFDLNKRKRESDGILRGSGKYPWKSKED